MRIDLYSHRLCCHPMTDVNICHILVMKDLILSSIEVPTFSALRVRHFVSSSRSLYLHSDNFR